LPTPSHLDRTGAACFDYMERVENPGSDSVVALSTNPFFRARVTRLGSQSGGMAAAARSLLEAQGQVQRC
jgi:hypothetical protein